MKTAFSDNRITLYQGDVLEVLAELPEKSVQVCISSPPYFGLRDYGLPPSVWGGDDAACGHEWGKEARKRSTGGPPGENLVGTSNRRADFDASTGSLCHLCSAWRGCHGLEPTPDCGAWTRGESPCGSCWICNERTIWGAVRRVMRDDATLWINVGDSYTSGGRADYGPMRPGDIQATNPAIKSARRAPQPEGLQPLDLMQMPDRLALALQADGWLLRSKIIWSKGSSFLDKSGSVMPESLQSTRWERCRVKVRSLRENRGTQPAKAVGGQMNSASGQGAPFMPSTEWKDCPSCPKCAPNDGLVLRKGSWRPTSAHETILMLAKSAAYYSDGEAVREENSISPDWDYKPPATVERWGEATERNRPAPGKAGGRGQGFGPGRVDGNGLPTGGRNLRNCWRINTEPNSMGICGICQTVWLRNAPQKHCADHPDSEDDGKNVTGHFAAFPAALVEPMVKASTPEAGSCVECGSPWARVVERAHQNPGNRTTNGPRSLAQRHETAGFPVRLEATSTTLGHRPTCRCSGLDGDGPWPILEMHPDGAANWPTRPAVVLDPFAGSATTLEAARKLGCHGIGIELNPEYCKLAANRLAQGVLAFQ